MDPLTQSVELLRRSNELRTRSARTRAVVAQRRAAAAERAEKSRRLTAAAAKTREAMMHAHGWEPGGHAMALSHARGGR